MAAARRARRLPRVARAAARVARSRRGRRRTCGGLRGFEDDRGLPRRARPCLGTHRRGTGGERGDGRAAAGAGSLRLRRLRPPPVACRPDLPEAADRTLPRDAVRVAALLPVRAGGGVARTRVRERLVRPLADDPARLAPGGTAPGSARARAGLEAAQALPGAVPPGARRAGSSA